MSGKLLLLIVGIIWLLGATFIDKGVIHTINQGVATILLGLAIVAK